ncbi:hypothetical protein F4679DRAFT_544173 [Xylaria curta]|nr:hypothetical protein F4679DRAFT_544173 [Xylaria curta]
MQEQLNNITEITKDLKQEATDVKTRLDGIDTRLDHMEARFNSLEQFLQRNIAARENNAIARMRNVRCTRPDDRLDPLFSVSKNTEIEGFPGTPADIDKLDERELNRILGLLGQDSPRQVQHKRQMLRRLAGAFAKDLVCKSA